MKKIAVLIITILSIQFSYAQSSEYEHIFAEANSLYDSGDYEAAVNQYNYIIGQGYSSWQLLYNMGNAYYRLDDMGHAILYYERALRLSPTNKEIKDNLKLAQSKTTDHIEEVPVLFLKEWFWAIVGMTSPKGWRIVCIVLTVLVCIAAFFFFTTKNYNLRKWTFVFGIVLLVILLFSAIDATFSTLSVTNGKKAIIVEPMVVVKGSPDAKSVDKFVLHDGTKVTINDTQDEWWQIEIADGKNGWINGGAERI